MVKVYALTTCPYCKKTKKFLEENGVDFEIIYIDKLSGEERKKVVEEVHKLTGMYAVPVTVHGDKVIVGYKEDELKKLVEELKK
ncbi:glutaredoxin [Ferroglobus placidus DSM 10642]|uniref:Glutaredoxin n=1 Tax=Ferroglobus placidus (strain DSM 10642 / AEDII12DO) TaxID=589924 RepID=D3RY63_FERPA|nr:glutaredoxin family protein [Ferroglobus placidus]ADC65426.1 glutaredoxin [Ferroglobus placidus DSM 10642]